MSNLPYNDDNIVIVAAFIDMTQSKQYSIAGMQNALQVQLSVTATVVIERMQT